MGLKIEGWLIKASHHSVDQNHVRSALLHTAGPTGNCGALRRKGKTQIFTQGAFTIKREGRRNDYAEAIRALVRKTNIYKKL